MKKQILFFYSFIQKISESIIKYCIVIKFSCYTFRFSSFTINLRIRLSLQILIPSNFTYNNRNK